MRLAILAAFALILSGCASVIDGTSQSIGFASNPPGADCEAWRDGKLVARITTPNTVTVKKTKHDINVTCKMDGYHDSTDYLKSEIQDATWGNILLGGGIGWAIDSASGADNKYSEQITLTMVPLQPGEVAKRVVNPSGEAASAPAAEPASPADVAVVTETANPAAAEIVPEVEASVSEAEPERVAATPDAATPATEGSPEPAGVEPTPASATQGM